MSEEHTISKTKRTLALGIVLFGILFAFAIYADAQTTYPEKTLKPIYDKNAKVTLQDLAQYTSDQFEFTYGRLDYIIREIHALQNSCR